MTEECNFDSRVNRDEDKTMSNEIEQCGCCGEELECGRCLNWDCDINITENPDYNKENLAEEQNDDIDVDTFEEPLFFLEPVRNIEDFTETEMTDKTIPTNIHAGQNDEEMQTFWFLTNQGHDYNPNLKEYTLKHNNPEYHVIPKSDVDGDVMGALDRIYTALYGGKQLGCSEYPDEFQTIRNALITQSDPDTVTVEKLIKDIVGLCASNQYVDDVDDNGNPDIIMQTIAELQTVIEILRRQNHE